MNAIYLSGFDLRFGESRRWLFSSTQTPVISYHFDLNTTSDCRRESFPLSEGRCSNQNSSQRQSEGNSRRSLGFHNRTRQSTSSRRSVSHCGSSHCRRTNTPLEPTPQIREFIVEHSDMLFPMFIIFLVVNHHYYSPRNTTAWGERTAARTGRQENQTP